MSALVPAPSPSRDGSIMVVDDNPANLNLLEKMLCQHGYEVRSFPRGRLALAAAAHEPPELILLDINMPEMDGYEVCRQIKSSPELAAIPVIFLSALNATEDKVKGFRVGGIDYISKPFQFEEVQARVETHIQLRRARRREQDLLERTVGGVVETLWELVQLTAPILAARSRAIREIVAWVAKGMNLDPLWQYELAANLCLMGCLTLPELVFDRAYAGQKVGADDERMFRAHPETGARLLSHIPRLEPVAEMIRLQQDPWTSPGATEPSRQGAVLLHLAQEFDRRICRGTSPAATLTEIRLSCKFDTEMLRVLKGYSPAPLELEARPLRTRDLRPGMVLDQDVISHGVLILKNGTLLTETWIERLTNFVRSASAIDQIKVRVGGTGDLPKCDPPQPPAWAPGV